MGACSSSESGGGTVYGRHSLGSTGVRIIGDPIAPNSIRNRGEHVRALKGEGKEHMSKMVTLGLIFFERLKLGLNLEMVL